MSFLQVQQSLVSHRKTLRLARLLSLDRYAVVGRLVALWAWCLDNALDGQLGSDIDPDILADVMGWDAATHGKPSELVDSLITAGFLDVELSEQGQPTLHIHDWYEHMGQLIEAREKARENAAERQRRHRARLAAEASEPSEAHASPGASPGASEAPSDGGAVTHDVTTAVTPLSRSRHAHVTDKSRVEKSNVEQSNIASERDRSPERERTHETIETAAPAAGKAAAPAADAALSLVASAPASSPSSSPSPAPSDSASSPDKKTAATKTTKTTVGARVPDPVWDVCLAAPFAPPSNRVERGRWAKGIQALKESLAADGSPPSEIRVRALRYRARFGPSVPLNPMALAGNWTQLATDIQPQQHQQEGSRHGNQRNVTQRSASATSGTHGRRSSAHAGRPAIGTAAYYAQAAAAQGQQPAQSASHAGGVASQGGALAAVVGEW